MKKLMFIAAVCAFLTAPVLADTVTSTGNNNQSGNYNGYGPWQTGSGGEFTLVPDAGLAWVLAYYDSSTSNQVYGTTGAVIPSFQTFCVEENEYIYAGVTYNVVLNDEAVLGGVGGPHPDPISVGTAWLYHQFQNQTLQGYEWTDVAGRHASAAALQNTIWWLEGEAGDPGATNVFRNAVIAKFTDAAGAMADNNGQYAVAVLNLYDANGGRAQDMLVCVPIPAALLLGLLGLGAAGLKLRKYA